MLRMLLSIFRNNNEQTLDQELLNCIHTVDKTEFNKLLVEFKALSI